MTRIRFKALRAIALLQLGLLALLQLADAELEFYQDEEPKLSNNGNNNLERLVRLLEAKRHSHQYQQMQPVEPVVPRLELERAAEEEAAAEEEREELLYEKKLRKLKQQLHQQLQQQFQQQLEERQQEQERSHQQHLLELARQKQRGLLRDDLPERPSIIDALQREAAADPLEYVLELERQRLLPYLEFEPEQRSKPYSIEDETRARLIPAHANKDPMLDYPESQDVDLQRARGQLENARRLEEARRPRPPPPFTIDLDKLPPASDPNGPPPFAVRPNDPRYFHQDHHDKHGHKESHELPVKAHPVKLPEHERKSEATTPSAPRQRHKEFVETLPKTSLVEVNMLPEPRRRAEQDPMIISLDRSKTNNDVYFIAIVAGCSAATMFALVLISLTWCRLQRVSKAAADVEYPAYGVTGPNKDMSPSGDQRLAQSAQMYHFQHQKQQIIAMEKASAARDPGSVSEAESDEENEEGDYTVYECPGLAPTAEMEVKNPLFDDDPTPATPARSRRSADDDV